MLNSTDKEYLEKLEEQKKEIVKQLDGMKQESHICFLSYQKLKRNKKKINAEIKKIREKSIPDIIA